VVEEADETVLWIEILIESEISTNEKTQQLLKEAHEILAIMAASKKTVKENYYQPTPQTITNS
jgi:four helix bundle protein